MGKMGVEYIELGGLDVFPVFQCRTCKVNRPMTQIMWDGLELPSTHNIFRCNVCHTMGMFQMDERLKSAKSIRLAHE